MVWGFYSVAFCLRSYWTGNSTRSDKGPGTGSVRNMNPFCFIGAMPHLMPRGQQVTLQHQQVIFQFASFIDNFNLFGLIIATPKRNPQLKFYIYTCVCACVCVWHVPVNLSETHINYQHISALHLTYPVELANVTLNLFNLIAMKSKQ